MNKSMFLIYKSEINENKILDGRELQEYSKIHLANSLFDNVISCKRAEIEKECKKLIVFLTKNKFQEKDIYFKSIKKEIMSQDRKMLSSYRFLYDYIIKNEIDFLFKQLQNGNYFNNELFFEYLAFYINKAQMKQGSKEKVSKLIIPIFYFVGDNIQEIFNSRDYILSRYPNCGELKKEKYEMDDGKIVELEPKVIISADNIFDSLDLVRKAEIIKSSTLPILYLLNETKYFVSRGYGTYLSESLDLFAELNISSRLVKL